MIGADFDSIGGTGGMTSSFISSFWPGTADDIARFAGLREDMESIDLPCSLPWNRCRAKAQAKVPDEAGYSPTSRSRTLPGAGCSATATTSCFEVRSGKELGQYCRSCSTPCATNWRSLCARRRGRPARDRRAHPTGLGVPDPRIHPPEPRTRCWPAGPCALHRLRRACHRSRVAVAAFFQTRREAPVRGGEPQAVVPRHAPTRTPNRGAVADHLRGRRPRQRGRGPWPGVGSAPQRQIVEVGAARGADCVAIAAA